MNVQSDNNNLFLSKVLVDDYGDEIICRHFHSEIGVYIHTNVEHPDNFVCEGIFVNTRYITTQTCHQWEAFGLGQTLCRKCTQKWCLWLDENFCLHPAMTCISLNDHQYNSRKFLYFHAK